MKRVDAFNSQKTHCLEIASHVCRAMNIAENFHVDDTRYVNGSSILVLVSDMETEKHYSILIKEIPSTIHGAS